MLTGIDVSNWQGVVDWAAWKRRGIAFAFAKATEGTGFRDGQFPRNWGEMQRVGLVRGAYHFAHPANNPTAEADFFLDYVRRQRLDAGDLLALDLEVNDGRPPSAVASYARAWCERVRQQTARTPLVYTYLDFARAGNCSGLDSYPLWIADPSAPAGRPRVPPPWRDWAIHQHATNPLDQDVSRLTVDQLREIGGADPVTPEDINAIAEATTRKLLSWNLGVSGPHVDQALQGTYWTVQRIAQKQGAVVDTTALAQEILAGLTPQAIAEAVAAALPRDLAVQVADELARRLQQ